MSRFLNSLALEGNIRVLALQTLVSMIGFGALYALWQPYIVSIGLSVVDLGVIQSILNMSTTFGLFLWGALSDRIGRKPVILVSHLFRAVGVGALLYSNNIIWLIFFAFFAGFSTLYQSGSPARSALITESVPVNRRATAYSTLMAIGQITTMITASAGGYIALQLGYTPIFWITLIGELLGIGLMWAFLDETHPKEVRSRSTFIDGVRDAIVPERKILDLSLILALMGFGYGTGYSLFFGTLVDTYKFTPLEIGLLSTVFSLTWGVSSIPLGKLADRLGRKPMLLASCTCSFIAVIGFLTFRSFPFLLLFQMVSGIDPSFWIPSWISLVSEKMEPNERSRAIGKLDAYNRFLMIPAPYLAGILYTNYGFSAPLLVHLAFLIIWSILVYRIKESKKQHT